MQRDFGNLANILASTEDLSAIPKMLIFSQTKNDVCTIFSFLRSQAKHKHAVSMYHASQSDETKSFIQTSFRSQQSELRCLSSTIAFGMVCMCIFAWNVATD